MVINIKYYVITIIAIFLAIGVGIFIGIMLDGQDLITQQQQQLVVQLQNEFDEIKEIQNDQQLRINMLNEENNKNLKFMETVYPEVIKNKLNNLNIVILEKEDYSYYSLVDVFKKAGANNVTNILIKDDFLISSQEEGKRIAQKLNFSYSSNENIQKEIIKYLCDSLIMADKENLNILKSLGVIDFLENIEFPTNHIVIASGSLTEDKSSLTNIELSIINFLKEKNLPLSVVEKTSVLYSNIQEFKKARVSTVDNVDTLIGKVSIIMVIGGKEGNFGERSTAEGLMPQ